MPTVLALAMLWPITSRLRLALFRPERPCWNAMVMSFGGGGGGNETALHEGADLVVGEGSAVLQLQVQSPRGKADGRDFQPRQWRGGDCFAAAGGAHFEAGGRARAEGAGGPLQGVLPRAQRAHGHAVH